MVKYSRSEAARTLLGQRDFLTLHLPNLRAKVTKQRSASTHLEIQRHPDENDEHFHIQWSLLNGNRQIYQQVSGIIRGTRWTSFGLVNPDWSDERSTHFLRHSAYGTREAISQEVLKPACDLLLRSSTLNKSHTEITLDFNWAQPGTTPDPKGLFPTPPPYP